MLLENPRSQIYDGTKHGGQAEHPEFGSDQAKSVCGGQWLGSAGRKGRATPQPST